MPWLFLAVSLLGAWFTFNAFRPSSRWQILGVSFFAAWLTGELAIWNVVWQAVATLGFIALGALDVWPGWLGLAITFASWAGLVLLSMVSRRSGPVFDNALTEGIGLDPPERLSSLHLRQSVFPFLMRDRRVERVKNLEYGPFGRRNRLDIYQRRATAASSGKLAPVLFQIHGGGWVIGDKSQQGLPLMLHLSAEGWVCVAINYRLSPKATWPEHLIDCKRALAWVREHIAEYGGDPDLICVTGGSAGGHLAAMTALTANDPQYQPEFESADTSVAACVPFYGVYDFVARFDGDGGNRATHLLARWVMKTTPGEDRAAFEQASPINHVRADAPPFFVIHGSHDNLAPVSQARSFVERLRSVSNEPVLYAEVPGASHAFDVFYSTRTDRAVSAVDRFLAWIVDRNEPGTPDRAPADVGLAEAMEPVVPDDVAVEASTAPGSDAS